jgi:hypothetical protein
MQQNLDPNFTMARTILLNQLEGTWRGGWKGKSTRRGGDGKKTNATNVKKKKKHVVGYSIVTNTSRIVLSRDVILIPKSWIQACKATRCDNAHFRQVWEL